MLVLRAIFNFYRPRYVLVLVRELKHRQYNFASYAHWFWFTSNYTETSLEKPKLSVADIMLTVLLTVTAAAQLVIGGLIIAGGMQDEIVGGVAFGAAVILLIPIMLGLLTPVYYMLAVLLVGLHPKRLGHGVLCGLLEWQARRLRRKYSFQVVAVAGSVGKTSTKLAVARSLHAAGKQVRFQEGNYNARITVPLVLFGQPLPSLFNLFGWVRVLLRNELTLMHGYTYDIAVLELGTDRPGEMAQFAYLKPDITILTSISPEHMENFGSLDAVAREELTVLEYSKQVLVNASDVAAEYRKQRKLTTYSTTDADCTYYAKALEERSDGQKLQVRHNGKPLLTADTKFLGSQGRKIIVAAVAASHKLGIDTDAIARVIEELQSFSGRMQILQGIKGSTLLDDTYNAAPSSVQAALSVLTSLKAPQRIAVLGSMNELGSFSAEAHRSIGESLQPGEVDLLVTIGAEANTYLAPAAEANGCKVMMFRNPRLAGEYVKSQMKFNAVVLVKGSQNGVFSEEALKPLLADPADSKRLVRQSGYWMKRKHRLLVTK